MNKNHYLFCSLYTTSTLCCLAIVCHIIIGLIKIPNHGVSYYLLIPLLITLYLFLYITFKYLFKNLDNKRQLSLNSFIFCSELILYIPLYIFNLIFYPLLALIIALKLINTIIFNLSLFKDKPPPLNLIKPNYDLVLLGILSIFIAYVPELHQSKFSIEHLKVLSNSILILIIFIISFDTIKNLKAKT